MASANLSLNVSVSLSTGDKKHTPPGINFATPVGQFTVASLPAGDTTVNPPVGTTAMVVIIPPTAVVLKLKTIASDAGLTLATNATSAVWLILPISVSFIVNASASISGIEVLYL